MSRINIELLEKAFIGLSLDIATGSLLSNVSGRLRRHDPRKIWKDETKEFTPFLKENIDRLSEAIGLELSVTDSEAPVGSFYCDLVGKDLNSDKTIIIENQLGQSNHDHLGKIITYATGQEAEVVIWVSSKFRKEHAKALDWLNRISNGKVLFFGIEVEVLQIDDSALAPSFKVVAQPSELEQSPPSQLSDKQKRYHNFFTDLLKDLVEKYPEATKAKSAGYANWFSISAGRSGFVYSFCFTSDDRFRVELYIGTGDRERNKTAFKKLEEQKREIEDQLGFQLSWEGLLAKRDCRIATYREGSIGGSEEEMRALRSWAVEKLMKMRSVFTNRLKPL